MNLCTHLYFKLGHSGIGGNSPVPLEQAPVVERNTSVRVVPQDNSQPMPPLLARALCLNTHICCSCACCIAHKPFLVNKLAALKARLCAAGVLCLRRTQSLRAVREFCAGAIEKLHPCQQHVTPSHRHLRLAACCGASGTWGPRRSLPTEKATSLPPGTSCERSSGQATGCVREWVVASSEANP